MIKYQLLQGSSKEVLKQFKDNLFHCCVTSPPYWQLRDYFTEGQKMGFVEGALYLKTKIKSGCHHYWKDGYTMEPIIYCKKCDIELSDLIGSSAYDYKTREGKLIPVIFADQKHHL